MADPNHMLIPEHRIAVFAPCKVANLSIKWSFGLTFYNEFRRSVPEDWEYASTQYIATRCRDWLKIGICRNPFDRWVSGYLDKVINNPTPEVLAQGFHKHMTFDQAIDHMLGISDAEIDQHFRTQSREMTVAGHVIPDIMLRFEQLASDWGALAARLLEWGDIDLAPLQSRQRTANRKPWRCYYDADTVAKIAERYADDFRHFGYSPCW